MITNVGALEGLSTVQQSHWHIGFGGILLLPFAGHKNTDIEDLSSTTTVSLAIMSDMAHPNVWCCTAGLNILLISRTESKLRAAADEVSESFGVEVCHFCTSVLLMIR